MWGMLPRVMILPVRWLKSYDNLLNMYEDSSMLTLLFKFLIGHGDGLGSGDTSYKFIKRIFAGKFNQWLFARLHPNFGLWLAGFLSRRSRIANGNYDEQFHGEDKESLVQYCKKRLATKHYDYFVFGHRHLKMEIQLAENSTYINLGEWVKNKPYAVFDGASLSLKAFDV